MATTKTRSKAETEAAPKTKETRKLPKSLESGVKLNVRSNQYCTLGFTNGRTGNAVSWHGINDVQVMRVDDIEYMRSNAPRFLADTWIVIESVLDEEYADLTQEEVYKALGIERYFDTGVPQNLAEVALWDVDDIPTRAANFSRDTKDAIALALTAEIAKGNITDIRKIRAWEKALGVEIDTTAE